MSKQPIIVKPLSGNVSKPSAQFQKDEFVTIIEQKGYDVIHEVAVKCPCKSKSTQQQSNCRNCGGTGWAFINPTQVRAIIHSINRSTEYKDWSEENLGNVNISVTDDIFLSFMDRLTIVESRSVYSQILFIEKHNDTLYAYSQYNIVNPLYVALFQGENVPYMRLNEGSDYTFKNNQFILSDSFNPLYEELKQQNNYISITMRYVHQTQFHVIDLVREYMNSFTTLGGKEQLIKLPIAAIGRRAHYILDAENLSSTRIINNSFIDDSCLVKLKTC